MAIAKGLSDLEKDLITHISSLLNAQQVDGKAFSQSIDTLIAEVRSNFNGRRIYPFNEGLRIYGRGVHHPPFDTLKFGTSTDDIKLKLYR